ncbi:hypothetical protein [Streptomyces paradoxus]|uniref:hypothetical protein n=1 Tax=Streptomyces paradoxus TaxID=66375 RepID=UPI0037D3D780
MAEISATLKAHGGHDAAWVVIKAASMAEFTDLLTNYSQSGISALVGEAVTMMRAEEALAALGARPVEHPGNYDQRPANTAPQQGGYAPQQQGGYAAPAAPQGTPYGQPPTCPHGTKKFLERPYKNGKPGSWRAWACPAPQGDPTACKLEFIK